MPRHGVKCIRGLKSGVGIPAAPGVVAVVDRRGICGLGRRIVVFRAADIRLKEDVALGGEQAAAKVVINLVLGAVVVEVVLITLDSLGLGMCILMALGGIRMCIKNVDSGTTRFCRDRIGMAVTNKSISNIIVVLTAVKPIGIVIRRNFYFNLNILIPAVGIVVVGSGSISVMLRISVDFFGTQVVGVQTDLAIVIADDPRSVRLLQPVIGVAVITIILPSSSISHHIAVGILHMVPNQLILLGNIGTRATGPAVEIEVISVDFSTTGRPLGADALAEHHIIDLVAAAGVGLPADSDLAVVGVEHQGVPDQAVINLQNRAPVCLDFYRGIFARASGGLRPVD